MVGWIDLYSIKWLNVFNIKIVGYFVMYALFDEITTYFDYVFYSFFDRSFHFSLPHAFSIANKILFSCPVFSRVSISFFFLYCRALCQRITFATCVNKISSILRVCFFFTLFLHANVKSYCSLRSANVVSLEIFPRIEG